MTVAAGRCGHIKASPPGHRTGRCGGWIRQRAHSPRLAAGGCERM